MTIGKDIKEKLVEPEVNGLKKNNQNIKIKKEGQKD